MNIPGTNNVPPTREEFEAFSKFIDHCENSSLSRTLEVFANMLEMLVIECTQQEYPREASQVADCVSLAREALSA